MNYFCIWLHYLFNKLYQDYDNKYHISWSKTSTFLQQS